MPKNTYLTLSERIAIESSLREEYSFSQIGKEIGKDPSTISKEVRNHFRVVEKGAFNPCAYRKECKHRSDLCKPCIYRWGKDCRQCKHGGVRCRKVNKWLSL